MNLRHLKFEHIDHESFIWEEMGTKNQNIQKYTIYQGVKIYVRYENYMLNNSYWITRKTTYSLDKIKWTPYLTDIQAALKKLGK